MSIVGLFTDSRTGITANDIEFYFDATLEESSEMTTEVTEFPIEVGAIGNDHAVQQPLTLTMRVGISDNPFAAARANAGGAVTNLLGAAGGAALGQLSGEAAAVAGVASGAVSAASTAGRAETRSQAALDTVRDEIQRRNRIVQVVASKRVYENMMIVSTRQETTKENEGGLELVIEFQQLLTVASVATREPIPARNDAAETQAEPVKDLGRLLPQ